MLFTEEKEKGMRRGAVSSNRSAKDQGSRSNLSAGDGSSNSSLVNPQDLVGTERPKKHHVDKALSDGQDTTSSKDEFTLSRNSWHGIMPPTAT